MLGGMALSCLMFTAGCGSNNDLATVTGKVTLDGKPLEGAQVVFAPTGGGTTSYGRTDANGEYQMMFTDSERGAWLGENVVRISTEDVGTGDSPAKKEVVPGVYNSRSTLKVTVEKKPNVFDFDLKSDAGNVRQMLTE